jgi:hypothetical protein
MKSYILTLLFLSMGIVSYKETNYAGTNHLANENINSNKIILNVTKSYWYTSTLQATKLTFGHVNLIVAGETNAEKVTVQTKGDGVIGEYPLKLRNGKFCDTIQISFTLDITLPYNSAPFYSTTTLKAYLQSDVLETILTSDPLNY